MVASRYRVETLAARGDATAPHGGDQQLRGTRAYPILRLSFVSLSDCRRGTGAVQLPGRQHENGDPCTLDAFMVYFLRSTQPGAWCTASHTCVPQFLIGASTSTSGGRFLPFFIPRSSWWLWSSQSEA